MNSQDVMTLLPLIILTATSVIIMLQIAVRRSYAVAAALTVVGLTVTLLTLVLIVPSGSAVVGPLLVVDGYARLFIGLIVAATLAVTLLSYAYLKRREGQNDEFYLLLVIAALGSSVLAASIHFASFFLGLEILSVSLYALIGYRRTHVINVEAAIKYLILAGVSSAFLLFGMAVVYGQLGTMELGPMASLLSSSGAPPVVLAGLALILVGVGFKLAVVPFHLWTPDIYEGAPAPITAFIATVSKGAVFALLLRYSSALGWLDHPPLFWIFWLLAVASMVAGNFLALLQHNVKRILAYSSIANLGYLLVPFLAGGLSGITAVIFYLVAYFATILVSFGVVSVLSSSDRDADNLDAYRGLFWRRPWLATMFTVALLSLAGIPLTAGFVAKFYAVAAGAGATLWALIVILVLSSAVGLYYYLRVIVAMYSDVPQGAAPGIAPALAISSGVTLVVLTVVLLWLGVYPSPLLEMIRGVFSR